MAFSPEELSEKKMELNITLVILSSAKLTLSSVGVI